MKASRTASKRGQTSVEYILLLGLVVGVMAVVRVVLEPGVVESVAKIVEAAQGEAWVGGSPTPDPERPYGYYYSSPSGDGSMEVQ